MPRMELDLTGLIERYLAGTCPPASALEVIEAHRDAYAINAADLDDLDRVDEILERRGRLLEQIDSLVKRFQTDKSAGRIADMHPLVAAAAALVSRVDEGAVHYFTALRLIELRDRPRAEELLDLVPALREPGDPLGISAIAMRAECLTAMGETERVVEFCREMESAIRDSGYNGCLARLFKAQAAADARLGNLDEAIAAAREAIRLRQAMSDEAAHFEYVPSLAKFYETLGHIYRDAGVFGDALQAFEAGRMSAEQASDAYLAAWLLSEIGITWERAGDQERGKIVLERAAREANAIGAHNLAARWLGTAPTVAPPSAEEEDGFDKLTRADGLLRGEPARPEAARALYAEVMPFALSTHDKPFEVLLRSRMAECYIGEGKHLPAEMALREAIHVAREAGLRGELLRLRLILGQTIAQRGRLREAEAIMQEAIEQGESLWHNAGSVEMRQTITAGLTAAYEFLSLLAAASVTFEGGEVEREPDAAELLEWGQRCRSLNWINWLTLADIVEQANDVELADRAVELRAAEVALERASAEVDLAVSKLSRQLNVRRRRLHETAAARGVQWNDRPQPLSVDELRTSLEPGEVLVDLLSGEQGCAIACLAADGKRFATYVSKWNRDERIAFLPQFSRAIKRVGDWEAAGAEPDRLARAAAHLERLTESLDENLFRFIVEAIAGLGSFQRVFIAPHRELFQLPFGRLADHLAESMPEVALSILPTSSAAARLRARKRDIAGERLVASDPTATLDHAGRETAMVRQHRFESTDERELLDRLHSAVEAHFCCHGLFDARNPYRSGLIARKLTDDRDPLAAVWMDRYELLTVSQIVGRFHWPMSRSVVLSACETGLPRLHPASEFTSLPAAFLIAGARNVVASLWRAHDGAASLMMEDYYEELANDPQRKPSRALAAARRRLRKISWDDAANRLADARFLPERDSPFDAMIYADAFQHYGVD